MGQWGQVPLSHCWDMVPVPMSHWEDMLMNIMRYIVKITGIVQGVGFRPFVCNLANSLNLSGYVENQGGHVVVDIEGQLSDLDTFMSTLKNRPPVLAQIKKIYLSPFPPQGYNGFVIKSSTRFDGSSVYLSADIATCKDCGKELFDSSDPRYLYPFINCTNCGPRFTIISSSPYDRENTTMAKFELCPSCKEEYQDPNNRRYHAEPISCKNCGPSLILTDSNLNRMDTPDVFEFVHASLMRGSIVAIKGLGGYHLACNAKDENAVERLRKRKCRDDKPFALMTKDLETARKLCYVNPAEEELLTSCKRPIVLLKKQDPCCLPEKIAPKNNHIGVMLPYTPVHMMLFNRSNDLDLLVMTSGNISDEPIYYKDIDALSNLQNIADYFLFNDREIFTRTDDSVTRSFRGNEFIIRRSRGYAPVPVSCNVSNNSPSVLAVGAELKDAFCMNKSSDFFLSHHIGDLKNLETLRSFEEGISHFKKIFNIEPKAIAYDMHPSYLSTQYTLESDITYKIAVQHHHAHVVSCMAENCIDGEVIGVAFDGTGYGEDGKLWGGEFLKVGLSSYTRLGHLEYVGIPGGDIAVKEPWRMAVSYLGNSSLKFCERAGIDIEKVDLVLKMCDKNINCPETSSAGRLFDAVSAIVGIRNVVSFEAQAAAELEYYADISIKGQYGFSIFNKDGLFNISSKEMISQIVKGVDLGRSISELSSRFHNTVAMMILDGCRESKNITGLKRVVLSGGVFQNVILLEKCIRLLENDGFSVFTHHNVPANDGGISLGQALVAVARMNG